MFQTKRKVLNEEDINKGLFLFIYLLLNGFLLSTTLIILIGAIDFKNWVKFNPHTV